MDLKYNFFDIESLIFCGDVHGKFTQLQYKIKQYDLKNCIIFVCGDFGVGFEKPGYYNVELGKLDKFLKLHNNYLFAIRGNHDDPEYFSENKEYGNVILLPDYSIIGVNGYMILGIGGGTSIDRKQRIAHDIKINNQYKKYNSKRRYTSYWPNEAIVVDGEKINEINESPDNIDVIFTHSSPNFCEPFTKDGILGFIKLDPQLVVDYDKERESLTQIYDELKNKNISHWFYGHFHESYRLEHENVQFIGIDELEFKEMVLLNEN